MALKVGELFATMELEDGGFLRGLEQARAALEDLAQRAAEVSIGGEGLRLSLQLEPDLDSLAGAASAAAAAELGAAGAAAGQRWSEAAGSAVRAGGSAVNAALRAVADAARAQGAAQLREAGQYAGRMLSAGIAAGIQAGRSQVVNAAASVVRAAARAANAAAKIGSPSRLTAEMGKFWDQGWAQGMLRNARVVTLAAAELVERASGAARLRDPGLRAPRGRGEAGRSAPAIDYDRLAEAMNQRQVALYMNDRRVARVLSSETARAQNERNRSIALGYGK